VLFESKATARLKGTSATRIRAVQEAADAPGRRYSQNAMNGTPMTVTCFVFVLTPNCNLPPPFLGILTSVSAKTSSVRWSTFLGVGRLDGGDLGADADATGLRAPDDGDVGDPPRRLWGEVDLALERGAQP